ncbi:MAG: FAD-dependent oxidoreductase [Phycisphaeraceae bacterium]|nr:FAD-dependent oxidoreductase [Phycisphaeraceae bacterium]
MSFRAAKVVILGGGLAGLAAAVRLGELGVDCHLLEMRDRLGGRAGSFRDVEQNQWLDNCQHVLMGCCTALIDFYQRIGVEDRIRWHRTIHFVDERGRMDRLEADGLPAPLHLMGSVADLGFLKLSEKWMVSRAMHAMLKLGEAELSALHRTDFHTWLRIHGQSERLIERFWTTVIISALNEEPRNAAADYAMRVFRDGFLGHRRAYEVGLAKGSLQELYDPAGRAIERAGNAMLCSTRVESVEPRPGGGWSVRTNKGEIAAAHVISCLPFDGLSRIAPAKVMSKLGPLERIEVSPIVGVHLWFARPFLPVPLAALIGSPLHWVFDKGGGHVHGVISAARGLVDQPGEVIARMAVEEIRRCFPEARRIRPVRHRVIKEKRATFAIRPGIDDLRPDADIGMEDWFMAGDWCRTGWPATMEGAVRSGYRAVEAWCRRHRPEMADQIAIPDLPRAALATLPARLRGVHV